MKKIGAITIGQSPRTDVTKDLKEILVDFELLECGALDEYSYQEVLEKFQPIDDNLFVSRMRNGKEVLLSKEKIIKELNNCIKKLETRSCSTIIVFCTGEMTQLKSKARLLKPSILMHKLIPQIANGLKLAIVVPNEKQKAFIKKQWKYTNIDITMFALSPYEEENALIDLSQKINYQGFNLVYLDCIGYSIKMQQVIKKETNLPVILPRTILAEIAKLI